MKTKSLQSILPLILLLSVRIKSQSTLVSPCPEVFEYDHTLQYPGRWYGVIKLSSNYTLYGLWLDIEQNHDSKILKSCVGNVTRLRLGSYLIEDLDYIIKAGEVRNVQIYIEYDVLQPVPELTYIALNGREICLSPQRPEIPIYLLYPNSRYAEFGIDTRGCPYRPGWRQENPTDIENIEKSTETTQTTTVTSNDTDDNDDPLGGPITFVLPSTLTYHNNSEHSRCGRIYARSPLVVGEATEVGQWPWHVSITGRISFSKKSALYEFSKRFSCSGTIISSWHIITAAHCVTVLNRVAEKEDFSVMTARNRLSYFHEPYEQFIWVSSTIIVHPEYDHQTFKNDLSILKSNLRITFGTTVQPACFWPKTATIRDQKKIGTIAGWGFDMKGEPHEGLSTIEMSEVDTDSCVRAHDPSIAAYLSDKVYCAKYVNGTSKCHNDSGGGMMIKIKNRWYLRGVLSFYYSPELQNKCQSYALFTDIAKYLPWIKQHVYDFA